MPPAAAQGVRYDTGLSVASGQYGTSETTTSVVWSHGLAFEAGRFTLRATMPVIAQRGAAVLTAGGSVPGGSGEGSGGMMSGGAMGGRPRTAFGTDTAVDEYRVRAGDPVVAVTLRVFHDMRTIVSAGAAVKAPLAEAGDVGTGEWDGGVTLDVSRHVAGPWFAAASGAWWKLGDPAGLDLRDPVFGSLMLSRIAGGGAAALTLSAGTAVVKGLDPPVSGGAMVSRDLWGGSAAVSAALGMTDAAADFSLGLGWGVKLR